MQLAENKKTTMRDRPTAAPPDSLPRAAQAGSPQPAGAAWPGRVVIEGVVPEIDGGRFPIKRTPGDEVAVGADIYADGHDVLGAVLMVRRAGDADWTELPMTPLVNDRWEARFTVEAVGNYEYTIAAWVDRFATWRRDLAKKFEAGQDVAAELVEGADLLRHTARRIAAERPSDGDAIRDAAWLRARADVLSQHDETAPRMNTAIDPELQSVMAKHADRSAGATYRQTLTVRVDRKQARFGAWYEMFPRSAGADPSRAAPLREAESRLGEIAAMGFDVLYLPPIHPIGRSFRKGPNNSLSAGPSDPGSPWAIGAAEGGHKAVHPALGTIGDFDHFVVAARKAGLEIALDLAYQCSPDHPYVREHPEWFRRRPDGSIKYAENPPKKYQDIFPFDFECESWQALWQELKSIVLFWAGRGVKIFRVDNPHTKPFRFWEWLIAEAQRDYPDTIFLSEAFTRPKIMKQLAKLGFTQSYTYFTWRNSKRDLTEYFTELTQTEVREYMRPNLFTNTPDILHEYLQHGGRPAFQARLVLAATLGASYGIYGPPFELCEARAVSGTEEYQDSEKYQVRCWDRDRPGNIRQFITRVNQIRHANPALHGDWSLRFWPIDNEQMIFYSKTTPDRSNIILVVVNLDPRNTQSGWARVPVDELGLDDTYQVHDLLNDARYLWHGETNFVQLDPSVCPAHIFHVRRRLTSERDYEHFS
jgi:starch synthase (maltosyl-transferring)